VQQDLDTDKLEARSERRIELVPKLALARMRVTVITADGSTIASLHARSLADGWEARAERREGVYTFNDIPLDAHEFRFSVGPGDRGTVSGSYLLDCDVRIDPLGGAEVPVAVDMALGGRLRVLRGDRNAVSPADLEIEGPGGTPISSLMARNEEDIEHGLPARAMLSSILQRSDWEVLEVFPNLPPGTYSLRCTRTDRTAVELPFTIRAGRGVDVELASKAK
jgi:hypothetical protein